MKYFKRKISIIEINDANFVGANVRANDTLNLNVGNNLNIESLRDEYSSNSKGSNVNAGLGFGSAGAAANRTPSLDVGKVSSVNGGFSVNNGVTQTKQTVLSSLTANNLNVNVGENTNLKGSLLASGNYNENENFVDNKNLNLSTNTLTFSNLSNSSFSSNQSLGLNLNYNLSSTKIVNQKEEPQQGGISSVGYNSSTGLDVNVSKTLATLGQGNITIKDKENSDDLTKLNTDTQNINKDLYSSSTGTKVDATLDTRLLSVNGLNQIKDDYNTATAITNAIEQIVTNDKVGLTDFFSETQKNIDVYNGVKAKIANDEELAKQLQNSDLNPTDKQNMLKELALTVMQELGYVSNDVKLIYTDETGVNNTQVKGYFDDKTNTSYVNDKYNDSTTQLIASLGHEISHDMDKQDKIFVSNDKDQNIYATNFGEDLAFYTNGALSIITGGSLADTNTHNQGIVTSVPSVFNISNNLLNRNNVQFSSLDKSGGDDSPLLIIPAVLAIQSYLNTPTNENDIHREIEGEIDKNMNQPMIKVINKSGEVINQFGNNVSTVYLKRDDISQDISTAYNNMPEWARNLTIRPAMTIVEYGATGWLPKPIANSYDIYSGQNFDTIPTSKWGWLGYGNNKLMENEKNNEK